MLDGHTTAEEQEGNAFTSLYLHNETAGLSHFYVQHFTDLQQLSKLQD